MLHSRVASPIYTGAVLAAAVLVVMLIAIAGLSDAAFAANPWIDRP